MKFDERFPNIAEWVTTIGWIEFGQFEDYDNPNFIMALNPGGVVWESGDEYDSVDETLQELDKALGEWIGDHV